MKRRSFLGGACGTIALAGAPVQPAAPRAAAQPGEPLVWPTVRPRPGIPSLSGHTDTVLDIAGRLGSPASLVIFTEGNHFMALLGEEIAGAFPSWARSRPQYADLDLGNIVVLTMPQPMVVQALRSGGVALGNLDLDISRASGFYPDVVMGGAEPLRQLRKLGMLEPRARLFSKNRGRALLVRKGNPLGIRRLTDVARTGARLVQPDATEPGARSGNRTMVEELIGKADADAFFAREAAKFPGRIGIMHRDIPEMLARGGADVGLTLYHLVSYWARTFPDRFEPVPIAGAERFPASIAFARVVDPLRPRALQAFEEFFFERARDVYPKYDFARMQDDEYGAVLALD